MLLGGGLLFWYHYITSCQSTHVAFGIMPDSLLFASAAAWQGVRHMRTRGLFFLTTFLLIASWVILVLSDLNAEYFLEVNTAMMVQDERPNWIEFMFEDNLLLRNLFDIGLIPLYFLFWAPALGIVFSYNSRHMQYMVVVVVFVLLILDVLQLLSFEGGDRKGCESCFVWWFLHFAAGAVLFVIGGMAGLLTAVIRGLFGSRNA